MSNRPSMSQIHESPLSSPASSRIVGRLAPSPTGAQHAGNARTYLLAWLSARSRGGQVILRMEDLDSPRVKPGAAQQAMDDLKWLGLDWDAGPDVGGPSAPYVQTERLERYEAALNELAARELVYPCSCTRSDVAASASAPHLTDEGPLYSRRCAHRSVRDADSLAPGTFCWRLRTDVPELSDPLEFTDAVAGRQSTHLSRDLGDFVIARSSGLAAYQLAVVVDDAAMGVTEVVRGDDLLPSTFRQLALYRLLNWAAPEFAHPPLVIGPDGRRLAKRHGDTRLATLREAGFSPLDLVGWLAWSSGVIPDVQPVAPRDLLKIDFDFARIPRTPLVFSEADWRRSMNATRDAE